MQPTTLLALLTALVNAAPLAPMSDYTTTIIGGTATILTAYAFTHVLDYANEKGMMGIPKIPVPAAAEPAATSTLMPSALATAAVIVKA